jgi:1,4-alpha-glucan branching enzyme
LDDAPADEQAQEKAPRSVTFRLLAPAAREVFLGGSFNGYNAKKGSMTRRPDGVWEATLPLSPGRYTYRFKVDGQWKLDPTNPERTPDPGASSLLQIQ